jgi:hypothetical protein
MCDAPLVPLRPGAAEDDVSALGRMVPTRNPAALAAYYLGIFSLVPFFGALLGPAAFFLGIKGARAVPGTPGQVGKVHAWIGIVLGLITSLANWIVILTAIRAA